MLTSVQHLGKLVIFVESLTILQKFAGVKTRIKDLVSKEQLITLTTTIQKYVQRMTTVARMMITYVDSQRQK
jgi:hypothetical protein